MSENIFATAGDTGDSVYALCTVKALGGGHLVFWPRTYVRDPMTPAKVEKLQTFFASQYYIKSVQFNGGPVTPTYNLDDFRATWLALRRSGGHMAYNLAELFLLTFNLPMKLAEQQWLEFPPSESGYNTLGPEVIFSRSFRYRNDRFPWKSVWEKYRKLAVFLGTENEWQEFKGNVGDIPHVSTPTLLQAAEVISTCKLFIGNQSALYAIAEGLKVPRILEVWRTESNCLFPGAIHGFDATVELPDL